MQFKGKAAEEKMKQLLRRNAHNNYSNATSLFAVSWAEHMEEAIDGGQALEDCAGPLALALTIVQADWALGTQRGRSVFILSQYWIHGDALRQWHRGRPDVAADIESVVNGFEIDLKIIARVFLGITARA